MTIATAPASVRPRPSARAALREATAQVHLRMHGLAPFAAIAAGRLARTGYAQLLRSLFQFHSAIAAAADRAGWSAVSTSGKKLELLEADLDHLGIAPFPPTLMLRAVSPEARLGAIYVAEGSMIGGKIIAGQLDYLLGGSTDGRGFFAGRGKADSLAWQRLIQVIEARLSEPSALDRAVAGAVAAFDLCEACVRQRRSSAGRHEFSP